MKTVALISQKGGVGKSTLAVNLAQCAAAAGRKTLLLDLDPQGSAGEWAKIRTAEEPLVEALTKLTNVGPALDFARQDRREYVFLDTAARLSGSAGIAAHAADLILIPCRVSLFDFRSIAFTIGVAREANKPFAVIFNHLSWRPGVFRDAKRAVQQVYPGAAVAPVSIGNRAAYAYALLVGLGVAEYEPRSKAAAEMRALFRWMEKALQNPKTLTR